MNKRLLILLLLSGLCINSLVSIGRYRTRETRQAERKEKEAAAKVAEQARVKAEEEAKVRAEEERKRAAAAPWVRVAKVWNKTRTHFNVVAIYQRMYKPGSAAGVGTQFVAKVHTINAMNSQECGVFLVRETKDYSEFLREVRVFHTGTLIGDSWWERLFVPDRWIKIGPYKTIPLLVQGGRLGRPLAQMAVKNERFNVSDFRREWEAKPSEECPAQYYISKMGLNYRISDRPPVIQRMRRRRW